MLVFLFDILRWRRGGAAPVYAVEDGSWPDVEEDNGVSWTEVVLDCPFNGEGALVAEVDGNGDAAVCGGNGKGREVVSWGRIG